MEIPAYIIEKFGKSIEDIRKAKTEGKQEGREILFEVKQAKMEADECKRLCKKIGVTYKEGYEERVLDYVCSDDSVDRMGDVLKQKGWKLENFKNNPVIMGFHNYQTYPVGNALKVKVTDGKLRMSNLFADEEIDEAADKAFRFAKSGFMKAGSVGFMPIEYHYPDDKERETLAMGKYGVVYDKMELLEFSVCGVPANANALQESINKGLTTKKDFYGMVEPKIYDELIEFVDSSEPGELTEKEMGFTKDDAGTKLILNNDDEVIELTVDENGILRAPEGTFEVKQDIDDNLQKLIAENIEKALIENKAGAKLSKKSKGEINKAISGMETAVTALKNLLEETDDSDSKNLTTLNIELDAGGDDEEETEYYPEGSIIEM